MEHTYYLYDEEGNFVEMVSANNDEEIRVFLDTYEGEDRRYWTFVRGDEEVG